MGVLKTLLKQVKIVQNVEGADLSAAAAWAAATDLGELKGKPFAKVTWDAQTYESQKGKGALGIDAKFETSTLEIQEQTVLTALKAMRGLNCSLQCTPLGTVSATNPIVIIRDFRLLISGELNIGDVSFVKLHGEKPALDESQVFEHDAAAA